MVCRIIVVVVQMYLVEFKSTELHMHKVAVCASLRPELLSV